jgi:hypothetical protein
MAAAIKLRDDYDGLTLRDLEKRSDERNQTQRLLALAVICHGGWRRDAPGGPGLGASVQCRGASAPD